VLLDEPTGNLDSTSAEEVLTILDRVNGEGATMVIVTHSSAVAERASRVLQLADGRVVADGPVDHSLALAAAP
jgi:ABC-type lipoprotein export system ATPase subunit